MALYTWINQETCIACGVCGATAPSIYDYDDEGIAFSLLGDNKGTEEVPFKYVEDVIDAQEGCPTESVKIRWEQTE
ncbi:ferredoxin [Gracilibacillus halotolerans]|uniref:Ferredoxin n=1 Tax=Gracilibacillus halotolerans TaxID=74386 RepID=A0A841RGS8_9BACI|nr:ferredoxin [Gracilibacillus halotolerans]MBB6511679.1 ferredoxin [Gracilibacillus halotolerans]